MFDEEIKVFGVKNNVPITKDETLKFLIEVINKYESKEILEIGTAIGYGSISMVTYTRCSHIDTVEIDESRYNIANENIKKHQLEDKITTHLIDARDYLENCTKTYDLVYLDGPKGQYINYLPNITRVLKADGIIIADNLHFHGMVTGETPVSRGCRAMIKGLHRYIDEVTTNPIYTTTIYNIGDGVGLTIKKE